jgi:hypothetical protein
MWYYFFMSDNLSPVEWAERVKASYDQQLSDEIIPPLLDETLLWATPGGDCFAELGKLGLKTVPKPSGVILQEIEPPVA